MSITHRVGLGRNLTAAEVDANFDSVAADAAAAASAAAAAASAASSAASAAAGKYTKPGSGIPAADLATAVQTSLGKADSALQNVAGMTTAFNAGTTGEKAAFRSAVSAAGNKAAGCGDSLMVGSAGPANAAYSKAVRHASGAYQNAGLFAVGGTRTDQILPQFAQAGAAGATIVVADGGANDLYQSVPEVTLRTSWIANVAAARAAGITRYIDVGMPPTNVSSALKAAHANHEVWRGLYCFKNGIQHIDMWTPFATASGGWASGMNADNTHWSSAAAKVAGDRINAAIRNPISGYPQLLAMTDTAADVGTFVGNAISYAGQSGATPATGWFHTGTGGTYSVSAADAGDFGSWYRCTMSGGSNAGMGPAAVTLASLGWQIGDKLAIGLRLRWVDVSGAMPLRVQFTGCTPDHQPLWDEVGGATGDDIYLYDEVTINAGTVIGLTITGTGTGYFEVNRPIVVNLTKLGLA